MDRDIAPRAPAASSAAPPHQLGPVALSMGFSVGAEFNDNINGSQTNAESELTLRGGVNLGGSWEPTGNSTLRLSAGVGYIHYLEHTLNGGLDASPGSALTYAIDFPDGSVTLFDQLYYSRQVTQEPALANIAELPRVDNNGGLRVAWDPGRWRLQAGYSRDTYFSTSAAFQYLNSSSDDYFARAGWGFAERTEAGMEASASLTSYSESFQDNVRSESIGAYANWQLTRATTVTLRGGPSWDFFNAQQAGISGSSLDSYYFGFSVNNQLADQFSQSLNAQRSTSLGINAGSQYLQQTTYSYALVWQFRTAMTLTANVSYAQGTQPLVDPTGGLENFSFLDTGLGLSWSIRERLSVSLQYMHGVRGSNVSDRNYGQNIVSLGLNYTL